MGKFKSAFLSYMSKNGIKYTEPRDNTVRIVYGGDNLQTIPITVIFDEDDDGRATFDCWEICKFADSKFANGLVICNVLNSKYRWVKFYIDSDKDMRCQADAILDADTTGDECMELVRRMVHIIDGAYPDIMRALYN